MGGAAAAQEGWQEGNPLQGQLDSLKAQISKFNLYFNFQSSFDVIVPDKGDTEANFRARQLRLEMRGNITDQIFYRFRHRLNKSNAGASLDNLAKATDIMYAGFHLNDQFTLTAGKMCQAWGGFEFDLNPMNIYEYSDFVENMDNFMLGAMFTYTPNANHEFNLQITDVRNDKFENLYAGSSFEKSRSPLTYIVNWNGNLFDNVLQTRWAWGLQQEAKDKANLMLTLGTRLNLSKFQMFFDYMRADESLDRLRYASTYGNTAPTYLEKTTYNSFILKAEYQPAEQWNIFVKGMYETADADNGKLPTGVYNNERKSYGYYAGVEYIPFKDQDLRFFFAYVGRKFEYKQGDGNATNRFSLGMMYRIKAF